jgi:Flp pilus assembly protein CpaB
MRLNDMTVVEPRARDVDASMTEASPTRRRIGRPRSLPSGRAVLGGLLVATSMVGAVGLSRASGAPDTVPVLVASSPIAPFEPLGPHNLRIDHLALPDAIVTATYADADALAGTVSRSHIGEGELLQRGDVVESTAAQRAAAPAREISLRIDHERAVDGRLEVGDRVDVLATYGNGVDALTFVVLADAPLLSVATLEGRVGGSGAVVITLALDRRADTIALAHAADNADITVVRTTTAATSSDDVVSAPYRPPAGDR